MIKRTTKTNFFSAPVRKTSLIVQSGFKTIKKKSLRLLVLQGLRAQEVCVVVQRVQIILGEVFPMHQCFLLSSVGRRSTNTVQTGADEQDDDIVFDTREVVAGAGRGIKADSFTNGYQSRVQFRHSAIYSCIIQCFIALSVETDEMWKQSEAVK